MPSNFEIAALDAVVAPTQIAAERTAEITLNGTYVSLWRRPTPGQFAMFQLRLSRSAGSEQARAMDRMFSTLILEPEDVVAEGRLDEDGLPYAERLKELKQTAVGVDWFVERIEEGVFREDFLIDLLKEAIEIHSGFPTSSEPGSSSSPTKSGRPSTASSRRVKSTPSS